MKRKIGWFLAALALLEIGAILFLALEQRRLTYFPPAPGTATPALWGTPFQPVTLVTADGFHLSSWWLGHPQEDPRRPVVIYCHGNGADLSRLADVAHLFYQMGWDVLLFDYRGYGRSQGSFKDLNEEGLAKDAQAAWAYVASRKVPATRVLIWGHSLGSSVAARLAAQRGCAGLILEGAFPSLHAIGRSRYPWVLFPGFLLRDQYDTTYWAQARRCPVLFLHAERDGVIPPDLGDEVYQHAPGPKERILLAGIGHNDLPKVWQLYQPALTNFAQSCLGVTP